jgi:excisionase family DNA binding protein
MDDKRLCKYPGCRTRLNRYNDGDYCHEHEGAREKSEEQEVERLLHNSGSASRPGYLTVAQFAERVGYSDRTVRNWLNSGRIQGHRFGPNAKWFIPESEVDRDFSSVKGGTGSAIQAESGLPSQSPNCIEDLEKKYGHPFIVPERLRFLFPGYIPGEPMPKDMKPSTPSMQGWNRLSPSEKDMVYDILRWLGMDPRDFDWDMRRRAAPSGGSIQVTYRQPRPRQPRS